MASVILITFWDAIQMFFRNFYLGGHFWTLKIGNLKKMEKRLVLSRFMFHKEQIISYVYLKTALKLFWQKNHFWNFCLTTLSKNWKNHNNSSRTCTITHLEVHIKQYTMSLLFNWRLVVPLLFKFLLLLLLLLLLLFQIAGK